MAYANEIALVERTWKEWKRLTRFFESGRIARDREVRLWGGLSLTDPDRVQISAATAPAGKGSRIAVRAPREARADDAFFCGAALILSYSLAEAAALEALSLRQRPTGHQIEVWGRDLLSSSPWGARTWSGDLTEELAVEVAIVRNAFAHGSFFIVEDNVERMKNAGASQRFAVGEPISLDFETYYKYRVFLQQLLRVGGLNGSSPGPPRKPRRRARPRRPTRRELIAARTASAQRARERNANSSTD